MTGALRRCSLVATVLVGALLLSTAAVSAHAASAEPTARAVHPTALPGSAPDGPADVDGDVGTAAPTDPGDASPYAVTTDSDGDGLADGAEVRFGTSPTTSDTDGDGLSDGVELNRGTDPTRSDTDGDGASDRTEAEAATDPTTADTDGDGLADGAELAGPTVPTVSDTDGDGLADGTEAIRETDPTRADTDGDGLSDGAEVTAVGTDPAAVDSDGDLLSDGTERRMHVDPTSQWWPVVIPSLAVGFAAGALLSVGLLGGRRNDGRALDSLLVALDAVRPGGGAEGAKSTPRPDDAQADGSGPDAQADGSGPHAQTDGSGPHAQTDGSGPHAQTDGSNRDDPRVGAPSPPVADGEMVVGDRDEILRDDVRVQRLLEDENGRMRQSVIVEMTAWSKSKVSRLLSRMADEGKVVKVVLGRENLICLPGHEPEMAKSSLGR